MRVLRLLAREPSDKRTGSGIVATQEGRANPAILHRTAARWRKSRRRAKAARGTVAPSDLDVGCIVAQCAEVGKPG
jgi:hypothetical protein